MSQAREDLDEAVRRMRAGDGNAFRAVYQAVQPTLLRYLGVLVGPQEAEDVASETWGQACRDLDRFQGDADGFRGWITTIGRHRALDHLRRQSRRIHIAQDLSGIEPADVVDVEGVVLGSLSLDDVMAMIRSLPREQAEAVMLRSVMGFEAKVAARILGKRPGAVRTAAQRGLTALARRLRENPDSFRAGDILRSVGAEEVR